MTDSLPTIQFGQRQITYELTRSARKAVRVQVHPDGSVRVIAPLELADSEIAQIVRRKASWISKQLRFFEQFRPLTPVRTYRSGETHRYLGRQYRLKIDEGEKAIRLAAGFINITMPDPNPTAVEQILQGWYRQRANVYFHHALTRALMHFESYSIPTPTLKTRRMPTRWGSCTPAGVVYLNPELIKTPGSCIEYVLVHELCHLVHRRHDRTFYELLERILPDWQRRKQILEQMMA